MEYEPSTWPGTRLPHAWLDDGTAVQDRIPPDGYTLLRLGRTSADGAALARAFAALGAPFRVLDIADERPREIYGYDLLLLRPDMHIVWRGNRPPEMPEQLARMAAGH
jgi:hypothetical protein